MSAISRKKLHASLQMALTRAAAARKRKRNATASVNAAALKAFGQSAENTRTALSAAESRRDESRHLLEHPWVHCIDRAVWTTNADGGNAMQDLRGFAVVSRPDDATYRTYVTKPRFISARKRVASLAARTKALNERTSLLHGPLVDLASHALSRQRKARRKRPSKKATKRKR